MPQSPLRPFPSQRPSLWRRSAALADCISNAARRKAAAVVQSPTEFVTVTCPQCGAKGSVPAGTHGDLQCRKCAKIFSIDQQPPPEPSDDEIGLALALPLPSGAPIYK